MHLTATAETGGLWVLKVRFLHSLRQSLNEATYIAGDYAVRHARANHVHQRRTGFLTSSASLKWRKLDRSLNGASIEFVNDAPYAHYVEYETKAHRISPHGRALKFVSGNEIVFRSSVWHPGTKAMPFMQPAALEAGDRMHEFLNTIAVQRLLKLVD